MNSPNPALDLLRQFILLDAITRCQHNLPVSEQAETLIRAAKTHIKSAERMKAHELFQAMHSDDKHKDLPWIPFAANIDADEDDLQPFPDGETIDVTYRNGQKSFNHTFYSKYWFGHAGNDSDIIAYRVHPK